MKKLISILIVLITISCVKEPRMVSLYGEWLLIDATMVIEYDSASVEYGHFVDGSRSNLSLDTIDSFEINRLIKDTTRWEFISGVNEHTDGKFILNGDKLNPYGYNRSSYNRTIIENGLPQRIGGSSVPLEGVVDLGNHMIKIRLHTAYSVINGDNVRYYDELTFKKI